jgi:predicted aspartyl protease
MYEGIRAIALALLGSLLPFASYATCKPEALDLPVTITGTRSTITAKINGVDARFIIDSGAFFSMISSAAADEFKLKTRMAPLGLKVSGIGGITVPAVATVKTFTLANIALPNVEFLVGGSSVGSGSVGVLGQNFLERWDVEYNLAQGMIRLMKDDDCRKTMLAYWVKPDEPFSLIDIARTTPMKPHTTGFAYVNGVKIHIAFDTGAAMSMMTRRAAERAGLKLDAPGVADAGLVRGIGSSMAKSYIVPVDSIKFADGEEIKHTRLRVAELDLDFTDMLIGADFFLSHRIFDSESGLADFNRVLELKPDHVPSLMKRAELRINAKNVIDARADLDAIDKLAAKQADVRFEVAEALERANLMPLVITQLDLWIPSHDEDSRMPIALAARCRARAVLGQNLAQVLKDCNRAVSGSFKGSNPRILDSRAFVRLRLGDYDKAIEDYDAALKMNPQMPVALYGRGIAKVRKRKITEGEADMAKAEKMAPKIADLFAALGIAP